MNSDAITTIMQITHRKTNPPVMIPIHAKGRPDSLFLRIRFKEMAPNTSARIPNKKLIGKQMRLVNGNGTKQIQNNRMVRTPNTRLKTD